MRCGDNAVNVGTQSAITDKAVLKDAIANLWLSNGLERRTVRVRARRIRDLKRRKVGPDYGADIYNQFQIFKLKF